ncbi:ABC transporter ATP-binding protein/permease [Salipaludibacillus sp. CUR1]|uniref:ABC transporter ATP-binding protein n=1 Tax=Salipaludibacillus sp. CUR1 TaxID=2820003 RepID=UPI001E5CC609|nr:ABC transporter ATP-binding protein [Salipaludibacillus sp. CUR1]MCE7793685.1 ABC transporter ATP-binding protein/permease [Salipaludibacillus sp. CUR1]
MKDADKRLIKYAVQFKRTILLALFFLAIAAAAELTGPFIAKTMIDNHIIGIEQPWVEVEEGDVSYNGREFVRSDRMETDWPADREVNLLQVGLTYYFIDSPVEIAGERNYENGEMTITRGDDSAVYEAVPMTQAEIYSFFQQEIPYLLLLMGGYLLLILISSVFHYYQSFWLQTSANRIIKKMREDVFAKVHELPVQYFDSMPTGKIVSRITNDTEAIRELYVRVLATFFTSLVYMAGIFTALFILDSRLALATLTIIPVLIVWMILYRQYAGKYNSVIREKLSDINGKINENIQGMPLIQAFGREKEITCEFEKLNQEHFKYNNKLLTLNAMTSFNLLNFFRNAGFVALIWYFGGGSIGVGMVFSLGVVYAFVDYINRLFEPLNGIVNQLAQLEEARIAGERVFNLMDETGIPLTEERRPRFKGGVEFKDVSFAYEKDQYVLKNISFSASQGETTAFVGHTGSGKSSIMNILFRFYDHQSGKITVDGVDIHSMTKQELREHMAIVLQDPFLFTGTIASNVSMNDTSISRGQITDALRKVGAGDMIDSLPGGIDEEVKEKGSTLSAGQRQLISFARALVFNPPILILDEATANIDTETEEVIQKALEVVKEGRTTFVIAHRLSTIRQANQIMVLNRGEIVERGSHDELMDVKGRYYNMYQLQKGAIRESAG